MLGIEWLTTLGDVSWNFSKLIMKFYCKGKQIILRGKRGSNVTTVSTQRMEKVLHKVNSSFLMHLQPQQEEKKIEIKDQNLAQLLTEFADIFAEPRGLPPSWQHDHRIPILPGKPPANTRPYRYPHL